MHSIDTSLEGLKIIEPIVFGDDRGFFYESFNHRQFSTSLGHDVTFVQDNHSLSQQGVLRGLHFQASPHQQGKLVRVISGEVFDVAVDIRPDSATFCQYHTEILSSANKLQMWIPEGFAHGFLVLSEKAEFLYKTTDYWHPELERTILWNDPVLNIPWPSTTNLIISAKDQAGISLQEILKQSPPTALSAP